MRSRSASGIPGPLSATALIHKVVGEIFVEQTNKKGGWLGRPLEWVLKDDQSKPDLAEMTRTLTELGERSQRIIQRFLEQQAKSDGFQVPDPRIVAGAFQRLGQAMLADPQKLVQAQARWWQQMGELWQAQLRKAAGEPVEPLASTEPTDRRFKDELWNEDPSAWTRLR